MGVRRRCEYARDGQGSRHPREIWKQVRCCLDITVLCVRPASPPYVPLTVSGDCHTLIKVTEVDFRAWDIFMDNMFSSIQITCEFRRGSLKDKTRNIPLKTVWNTLSPSTFEIALFLLKGKGRVDFYFEQPLLCTQDDRSWVI